MRHRAVRESSDEMGAYARLYGGIEERLTAVEDLRANGAGVHAMWRFVEDSSAACCAARCAASGRSCACGGRCRVGHRRLGARRSCCRRSLVANGAITLGTAFLLFQYVR